MAKFLLKFNAAVLKEIRITKGSTTIGRKPDNDIVIDNPTVSGHHARLVKIGSAYLLEDLNSTNGTFLNDKKILRGNLKDQDTVGIGKHALVFVEEPDRPNPAPAPEENPLPAGETIVLDLSGGPAPLPGEGTPAVAEVPATATVLKGQTGSLLMLEGAAGEVDLTALLTYFGKSEAATIKIKGVFAPDMAALINRRPDGYLLKAIKEGYPKVNGQPVNDQQPLKDGDTIEIGNLKMQFSVKDAH